MSLEKSIVLRHVRIGKGTFLEGQTERQENTWLGEEYLLQFGKAQGDLSGGVEAKPGEVG